MPPAYLPRAYFLGTAVILVQFALGSAAMQFSTTPYWTAGLFLLGVPLGVYAMRTAPALAFPAICLFALTAVIPVAVVSVPLYGRVVNLRQVDDVPADHSVAGYIAPGWRIEGDKSNKERLTAGKGNQPYGHRILAPLVGDGWTTAHPVEVWVMGETRDSGRELPIHPKFWTAPDGEYARLVGIDVSGAQLQAQRAAQMHGLLTVSEPLIVMRRTSVTGAIADQYVALARALCWPLGAWAAMFAIVLAYRRFRARAYL